MITPHACTICTPAEGTPAPADYPVCPRLAIQTIHDIQLIERRAKEIGVMFGAGDDFFRVSFSETNLGAIGSTFEVSWEEARPGCDTECHHRDIPLCYLWMSDASIRAELEAAAAEKLAEQKARDIEIAKGQLAFAEYSVKQAQQRLDMLTKT